MKDEEYELLPHREIMRLREEVERLKANPVSSEAANLVSSISKLNDSIQRLIRIFEVAEKELSQEYKRSRLDERLNRVVYQNKEIAKGIIAVADLIKKRQPLASATIPVQEQASQASLPQAEPPTLEPESPPDALPPLQEEFGAVGGMEQEAVPPPITESGGMEAVPPPPEKKKILSWLK